MNNSQQKILHNQMLSILLERGVPFGYAYKNGFPVIKIEASKDGVYWPTEQWESYPPFRYSLDALSVVENTLTSDEFKHYVSLLGLEYSKQGLTRFIGSEIRFDALCKVFNLFDAVGETE